jgi:hypothetical protein
MYVTDLCFVWHPARALSMLWQLFSTPRALSHPLFLSLFLSLSRPFLSLFGSAFEVFSVRVDLTFLTVASPHFRKVMIKRECGTSDQK